MSDEAPVQPPSSQPELSKEAPEPNTDKRAPQKAGDLDSKDSCNPEALTEEVSLEEQESNEPSQEKSTSSQVDSPRTLDNEARLEQLEKEHETLKSQYMRIAADFDNFRKRQTRDNDDLKLQLTCNTLSEILPVVDNFERARQQLDPQGEEAQALHRSYQGLYKQLVDVLKQLGVAPMRVVGQSFDPNLHEAVLREPNNEHAEDIIIEELQRGYHLNGKVLRHALVKVSMGPGKSSETDKSTEIEKNTDASSSENKVEVDSELK